MLARFACFLVFLHPSPPPKKKKLGKHCFNGFPAPGSETTRNDAMPIKVHKRHRPSRLEAFSSWLDASNFHLLCLSGKKVGFGFGFRFLGQPRWAGSRFSQFYQWILYNHKKDHKVTATSVIPCIMFRHLQGWKSTTPFITGWGPL